MNWLRKLLGICEHEWDKPFQEGTITRSVTGSMIGWFYVCRCKKCGEIKTFKTIVD